MQVVRDFCKCTSCSKYRHCLATIVRSFIDSFFLLYFITCGYYCLTHTQEWFPKRSFIWLQMYERTTCACTLLCLYCICFCLTCRICQVYVNFLLPFSGRSLPPERLRRAGKRLNCVESLGEGHPPSGLPRREIHRAAADRFRHFFVSQRGCVVGKGFNEQFGIDFSNLFTVILLLIWLELFKCSTFLSWFNLGVYFLKGFWIFWNQFYIFCSNSVSKSVTFGREWLAKTVRKAFHRDFIWFLVAFLDAFAERLLGNEPLTAGRRGRGDSRRRREYETVFEGAAGGLLARSAFGPYCEGGEDKVRIYAIFIFFWKLFSELAAAQFQWGLSGWDPGRVSQPRVFIFLLYGQGSVWLGCDVNILLTLVENSSK